MKTFLSLLLVSCLLLVNNGCSNAKKAEEKNKADKKETDTNPKKETTPDSKLTVNNKTATKTLHQATKWNDPSKYFTDDVIGAVTFRPKQVWDYPNLQKILGLMLTPEEIEKKFRLEFGSDDFPADPRELDQVIIIVDKQLIQTMIQLEDKHAKERKSGRFDEVKDAIEEKDDVKKSSKTPAEIEKEFEEKMKKEHAEWEKRSKERMKEQASVFPLFIVHHSKPYDKEKWMKFGPPNAKTAEKTHAGMKYTEKLGAGFYMVDDKTVLFGSERILKSILSSQGSSSAITKKFVALGDQTDFGIVADLKSNKKELQKIINKMPIPGVGMVLNIDSISLKLKVTGKEGDSLLVLDTETLDAKKAKSLTSMLNGMLAGVKIKAEQVAKKESKGLGISKNKELVAMGKELSENLLFTNQENHFSLNLPIPKGYDKLPELIQPIVDDARKTAQSLAYRNNMRFIGIGFFDYHDAWAVFPRANGDGEGRQTGLSWRVHILPYLDQSALYKEFNLKEAWDSPHNKKLIDKMPAVFKTTNVTENGKTVYHVFTGKGSPFETKKTGYRIRDFTDGPSNTILFVRAAADKADVWTKPGGLDFDPKNPIKSIGAISGKGIAFGMGDSRVMLIDKEISSNDLTHLIRHSDGEIVRDLKTIPFPKTFFNVPSLRPERRFVPKKDFGEEIKSDKKEAIDVK